MNNVFSKTILFATFLVLFSLKSFGFSGHSGLAIVIIDMQIGFYNRGGVTGTEGLNNLVANHRKLVRWGVEEGIPVIVLEYSNFGETDSLIMDEMRGHDYKVVEKTADGGFSTYSPSYEILMNTLSKWNVDTLIIAGINGSACVKSTVRGAIENGFDIITSADIVGNLNVNPPTFPNDTWFYDSNNIAYFDSLIDIID